MSSAPITIPTTTASAPASAASSPTSGLYVPVHKRTGSSASSRSSSSTRSEASTSSSSSSERAISPAPAPPAHPLIYSRTTLLGLMQSPLTRLPLDTRESLRTAFPELVTNRKQRKALEYHSHAHAHTNVQSQPPLVRVQPRRNRPAGRAPERRRNATKVVDEASWRGRWAVAVPIAV